MRKAGNERVNHRKRRRQRPARPSRRTRTEAGKASSSRNAIRTGLYAARDFIRPGEEEEYAQTLIRLMDQLTPVGELEQTFATEIMGATWRLRRCRLIEENFAQLEDLNFDPMQDERTEKQQKSVDRARAQSHRILCRSIAELRKLQTERTIHDQLDVEDIPGLTDVKKVLSALKLHQPADNKPESAPAAPGAAAGGIGAPPAAPPPPKTPGRNAPCRRSGKKYKKCCGGPAVQTQNIAA